MYKISTKIDIELTLTIKSEITPCSLITLHKNMKLHIFVITQYFTNGMVSLQFGAVQIKYNIRGINQHKSDSKVEDSSSII